MKTRLRRTMIGTGLGGMLAMLASGQEATNTPAATQPGVGAWTVNQKLRIERLDDDPTSMRREANVMTWETSVTYGVTGNFSLRADVPVRFETVQHHAGSASEQSDHDSGFADPTFLARLRVWKSDRGPIDTTRVMVFGGVQAPLGSDQFSSDSVDPIFGAVMTTISGRHGVSVSAQYLLTTGSVSEPLMFGDQLADALRADAAYLYRIEPAAWEADTPGAWYAQLELNGRYETNADWEMFVSPGILYEGRRWAAEASVSIPLARDLDHRPETALAVTLGFRLLF